jgi:hypothetical protein
MKKYAYLIFVLIAIGIFIGAIAYNKVRTPDAVKPVEAFYEAIVTQDRDRISTITCADWEKDALREVDSFMGVKSELQDFSCSIKEDKKIEVIVTCSGSIAATYGPEVSNFPLEGIPHRVIKERGDWRICGH